MANRAGLKGKKNPMSKESITNRYNKLKEIPSISGSRVQIPPSPSYIMMHKSKYGIVKIDNPVFLNSNKRLTDHIITFGCIVYLRRVS